MMSARGNRSSVTFFPFSSCILPWLPDKHICYCLFSQSVFCLSVCHVATSLFSEHYIFVACEVVMVGAKVWPMLPLPASSSSKLPLTHLWLNTSTGYCCHLALQTLNLCSWDFQQSYSVERNCFSFLSHFCIALQCSCFGGSAVKEISVKAYNEQHRKTEHFSSFHYPSLFSFFLTRATLLVLFVVTLILFAVLPCSLRKYNDIALLNGDKHKAFIIMQAVHWFLLSSFLGRVG